MDRPLDPPPARTLERTLGFTDLVLIVVGTVIGSGIFIVPATVLAQSDGAVGTAHARVADRRRSSVAPRRADLRRARGRESRRRRAVRVHPRRLRSRSRPSSTGGPPSSSSAAARWRRWRWRSPATCGQFVRAVGGGGEGRWRCSSSWSSRPMNVRGTRQGSNVQNWSTGVKIVAILVMSVALLVRGRGFEGGVHLWPATVTAGVLSGVGLAMIGVLWAYEGWQYVTFSAGEARDPQRIFPRAIIAGHGVPDRRLPARQPRLHRRPRSGRRCRGATRVAADCGDGPVRRGRGQAHRGGDPRLDVQRGERHHAHRAAAVLLHGARRRVLPQARRDPPAVRHAGLLDRRRVGVGRDPRRVAAPSSSCSPTWSSPAGSSTASAPPSIFIYRRREPDVARPFRVPGYPVTPFLFVAAAAAVVLNTLVSQPGRALIGLAVVARRACRPICVWRRAPASAPSDR